MAKILEIESCKDCPNYIDSVKSCTALGAHIEHRLSLDKDCPLPDSGAAQQSMLDEVIEILNEYRDVGYINLIHILKQKYGGEGDVQK